MDESQELRDKTIWGSRFPTLDFTEGLSMRSIWTRLHGFDTNERVRKSEIFYITLRSVGSAFIRGPGELTH